MGTRLSHHRCGRLNYTDYAALGFATKFKVAALATKQGVSSRHLERVFKTKFGEQLRKFFSKVRLTEAKQLLEKGQPAKVVAITLFFKQQSHFTRAFSRHYGFSPKQARTRLAQLRNRPQSRGGVRTGI